MPGSHGGNIYRLADALGVAEAKVIDFSASINPLGPPRSVLAAMRRQIGGISNYPDPDAKRLRLAIAEAKGIGPDSVVCGNGSTELIYLMTRALRPRTVLIPAPTFSEYERACRSAGVGRTIAHELRKREFFDLDPDTFIRAMAGENPFSKPCDMAFICNPNNPTGRLVGREDMKRIAAAAGAVKCVLIVDEAFIDFCEGASVIDEVRGNPYLVVLRSLTKFYALSGLRVGYAVLPPAMVEKVAEAKEPWTVNSLAQIAGVAALGDREYASLALDTIWEGKKRLEEGFTRLGIPFLPSEANFYLLHLEDAGAVADHLKRKGILVRDCSDFAGLDQRYIRVAVKSRRDNARLLKEISLCRA